MRIAITGASGLVGTALTNRLRHEGHTVLPVVRRSPGEGEIGWDPGQQRIDKDDFEHLDAIIHLAGDNIASARWTDSKKQRIRDSRIYGTRLLSEALAQLNDPPKVFISASAIGYYGGQCSDPVDETSDAGEDFLANVCRDWESATDPAKESGIRTVNIRIGMVLSKDGGALAKMLTPFRLGLGGIVGSGQQIWSWVSIHDVVGAVRHAIESDEVSGPLNATSPNACTNAEFTKALGHVLHRPTLIPMPAFLLRLLLGEMADALLLASCQVIPRKLLNTGYEFQHEDLEATLRALLK